MKHFEKSHGARVSRGALATFVIQLFVLALSPTGLRAQLPLLPPDSVHASALDASPVFAGGRRTHRVAGAITGFIAGAGITWIVVKQGGSTSLCDRSANQDALNTTECAGIVVLGGLVGAGIGTLIGGAIHSEMKQVQPLDRLRVGFVPGRERRLQLYMSF